MSTAEDHPLDRAVLLHPLAYLAEGDEVTVGRRDIDSYAVLPADGAELVRRLESGLTPRAAANWYRDTYGEQVDILDMLDALAELGFLRTATEQRPDTSAPVRWQPLGRALFSVPAWIVYTLLIAGAVVVMIRNPQLVPRYPDVFFVHSFAVVELVAFVGQFPLILVHEAFHALAGRRLGLRSRLSIGRRLYFVVFETSLDGLVTVPRRGRVLPILAGMVADTVIVAVLVLVAATTASPLGRLCLGLAFGTLLRLVWQLYFYLRTDLYVLFTTALGCHDLHTVAKGVLGNAVRRLTGRPPVDESDWHPIDRRVARWYAWLMLIGYAVTLGTFVAAVGPVAYRFLTGTVGRLVTPGGSAGDVLDSGVALGLIVAQLAVIAVLIVRDRRAHLVG